MARTRAADFYVDSDDELPTVDDLLMRPPSRTQYKHSQPRPISQKNTTINKSEQRLNSLQAQITSTVDLLSSSGDTTPECVTPFLIGGKIRKEWLSSLDDQVGDGGCGEEVTPQLKGRFINTRGSEKRESGLQSRIKKKNSSNLASRIESPVSVRRFRDPSETADEAVFTDEAESEKLLLNVRDSALRLLQSRPLTTEQLFDSDQEEAVTGRPRNLSLDRPQTMKSNHQRQFPEYENGQDIIRPFSQLQLDHQEPLGGNTLPNHSIMSPKKGKQKGLVSPREGFHIKEIPRELDSNIVRNQESDNDTDEPHISSKPAPTKSKVPKTTSPKKQTKKSFDAKKDQLATDFLRQLDAQITHGKIGELTESTGGVKIVWSKTLKTTAGRANWKRETVVSKHTKDNASMEVKQYRHHSSIELAEKVIDDEQRLLNVIAHEFCHLANFMINGITDNPHGKEFKVWATQCSKFFGSQGIKVTTKHTYEIDFKYVWACTACGCEYKRHSKSIDPQRHRCGACKALLEQTKPAPRQAQTAGKLSDYQLFVKEQMKIVRSENPDSPQKDVMRIIADKWAKVKN
ncbi:hypothetical protein ACHAQJ_009077 [Trichoderma viride]